MNLHSCFALPLLLLLASAAQASHVVYKSLSLTELARRSETILVVEKADSFAIIEQKEKNGCLSQRWPLRVRRVLKAGASGIVDGQIAQVTINGVALRGCDFLKQKVMVSMVVDTYGSQSSEQLLNPPQRFIAFLRPTADGFELAAVNGIESESRLTEIVALIEP